MIKNRTWRVIALCASVAVIASVSTVAAKSSVLQHQRSTRASSPVISTTSRLAAAEPQTLLELAKFEISSGLDAKLFTRVSIVPEVDGSGSMLDADVVVPSGDNGDFVLAEWQAELAAAAIWEKSIEQNSVDVLRSVRVQALTSDGTLVDGRGVSVYQQVKGLRFPTSSWTDIQITDSIDKVIAASGMQLVSVRVLRPLDPAVVVSLRTSTMTPTSLESFNTLLASIRSIGNPQSNDCSLDGVYIEIADARNHPLVKMAENCRISAGTSWNSADSPIQIPHGGDASVVSTTPATDSAGPSTMVHGDGTR